MWFQEWYEELGELSLENPGVWKLYIDGLFCPKHILFELENVRGIMCHDTEKWWKVWRKTGSWFQKWHEWIWWMLMRAVARLEICTFMWYFYQWHINFQPKKYRRIISHDTEKRSKFWRKTDFLFEKWHEELWWTLTWAVESLKICTSVECM